MSGEGVVVVLGVGEDGVVGGVGIELEEEVARGLGVVGEAEEAAGAAIEVAFGVAHLDGDIDAGVEGAVAAAGDAEAALAAGVVHEEGGEAAGGKFADGHQEVVDALGGGYGAGGNG